MGRRNYLVEGVSGTGKTSVGTELSRRGHHVVHGDRELAYQGDPVTGTALDTADHEHHIWDVDRVHALVADQRAPVTFFRGGSRNVAAFVALFDRVFVLTVDADTLRTRLDRRPEGEWGARPEERARPQAARNPGGRTRQRRGDRRCAPPERRGRRHPEPCPA